jgi:hypothetical protein
MTTLWEKWNQSPLWVRGLVTAVLSVTGFVSLSLAGLGAAILFGILSFKGGLGPRPPWPGQAWWRNEPSRRRESGLRLGRLQDQ